MLILGLIHCLFIYVIDTQQFCQYYLCIDISMSKEHACSSKFFTKKDKLEPFFKIEKEKEEA